MRPYPWLAFPHASWAHVDPWYLFPSLILVMFSSMMVLLLQPLWFSWIPLKSLINQDLLINCIVGLKWCYAKGYHGLSLFPLKLYYYVNFSRVPLRMTIDVIILFPNHFLSSYPLTIVSYGTDHLKYYTNNTNSFLLS